MSKEISYAESLRELKEAWNNEPVVFIGGVRLNHNVCYND
jgi:hypothetical protein